MTGGQVAALGCAITLLLPGGCFLLVGIGGNNADAGALSIGLLILMIAVVLFVVAFSRRPPPQPPSAEGPPR
jgi:hypothetical protein